MYFVLIGTSPKTLWHIRYILKHSMSRDLVYMVIQKKYTVYLGGWKDFFVPIQQPMELVVKIDPTNPN